MGDYHQQGRVGDSLESVYIHAITYKNEKVSGEHSVGVEQKIKSIGVAGKEFYGFVIVQY